MRKRSRHRALAGAAQVALERLESRHLLTVFTVNTSLDLGDATPPGDGIVDIDLSTEQLEVSLRGAIEEANASVGADTIDFQIPLDDPNFVDIDADGQEDFADESPDVVLIKLSAPLPLVDDETTIHGLSQGDFADTNPAGNVVVLTPGDGAGFHEVTVTDFGQFVTDIDFANRPLVSLIRGTLWLDADRNGQSSGDQPIAGRRVYVDVNENGLFDQSEPESTTHLNGEYEILGTPLGTHTVRQVLPEGWLQTFPESSQVAITSSSSIRLNLDFGSVPSAAGISGRVWNDENRDGVPGQNEAPASGILVFLDLNANDRHDPNSEPIQTTDDQGRYGFDNQLPGEYRVRTILQPGQIQTFPRADAGEGHVVQLAAGESLDGIDFGVAIEPVPDVVTFSGVVYPDLNSNGAQDANEPGLPGIPVTINGVTVQTDDLGRYFSTDVAGRHVISIVVPEGWTVLEPPGGSLTGTAEEGSRVERDFIVQVPRGLIAGSVFLDDDADANQSMAERGLANWSVFIDENANGTFDDGEPVAATNFRGDYFFVPSSFGSHRVAVVVQNGFVQTLPSERAIEVVTTREQPLAADVDFGFDVVPATVQGLVWFDENQNGTQESSELIITEGTVYLDLNRNAQLDAGDPIGMFLENGRFEIQVDRATPTDAVVRLDSSDWVTAGISIDLGPGDFLEAVDLAASQVLPSVAGRKWLDETGEGVGGVELELSNWVIYADLNRDGELDPQTEPFTTTDTSGAYKLDLPGPGTFRIAEQLQPNWQQTFPVSAFDGLVVRSNNNQISGLAIRRFAENGIRVVGGDNNAFHQNELTLNGGAGVAVVDDTENRARGNEITENSIFANTGLGIDLGPPGVNENDLLDEDVGANNLQNTPELTFVLSGEVTQVDGLLQSAPLRSYRIDVYANEPAATVAQGQRHLGHFQAGTGDDGIVAFSETLKVGVEEGAIITATATDEAGNTSEFSAGQRVVIFLPSSISGRVLEDVTADGFTEDDRPLASMEVRLWRDNSNGRLDDDDFLQSTMLTSQGGEYTFQSLSQGTFFVEQVLDDQYIQTAGGNGDRDYYTITTRSGHDFLNLDFAKVRLGRVEGTLWNDRNRDGEQQVGEPTLSDWPVVLKQATGEIVQTTRTDEAGHYQFRAVPPGDYLIVQQRFDGWEPTFPSRRFDLAKDVSGGTITGFAASADFNNAATPELVIVNDAERTTDGKSSLWLYEDVDFLRLIDCGIGDLSPACVPTSSPIDLKNDSRPQAVVAVDLDGDLDLDLAVAALGVPDHEETQGVLLMMNNGAGAFELTGRLDMIEQPLAIAAADVNRDSIADLIVTGLAFNEVVVLLGRGNGDFDEVARMPVGVGPTDISVEDLNGDFSPDIAVAGYHSDQISIFRGDGQGGFSAHTTLAGLRGPSAVEAVDVNRDGIRDLVVANHDADTIALHLGSGDGSFQQAEDFATAASPQSLAVRDVNSDNRLDVIAANSHSGNVSMLLGRSDGRLSDRFDFAVPATNAKAGISPQSVVANDLDGDDQADLVVGLFVGGGAFLLNREPSYSFELDYGVDRL